MLHNFQARHAEVDNAVAVWLELLQDTYVKSGH